MDEAKKKYLFYNLCKNSIECDFKKDFKPYFLEYFPDRSESWYVKYKMQPLQPVSKNDITTPIQRLLDYYKTVPYFKLLKKSVTNAKKFIKDDVIKTVDMDYDRDAIFQNYLQCWENLQYTIIFNYTNSLDSQVNKIIQECGNILMEKTLEVNRKEALFLLFWTNIERKSFKNLSQLESIISKLGWENEKDKRKIKCYFFDRNPVKTRDDIDLMAKTIEFLLKDEHRGFESVYYQFGYDSSYSYASLVLNPSNFLYFNEALLSRFIEFENDAGKLLFLGIRNYLVKHVDTIDLKRFLLFSGLIFYFYGLRRPSDIDIIIYHNPEPTGGLKMIAEKYPKGGEHILGVGDNNFRGYGEWKVGEKQEYLEQWFLKEWPNHFGAKDYEDMIFNPRFHITIMGIKLITMEADIERRRRRFRAAAYADLIGYNYYLPLKIEIEEPPIKYYVNHKYEYYDTPEKLMKLVKTIKNYLRIRYNLKMSISEIVGLLKLSKDRIDVEKETKIREFSIPDETRNRIKELIKVKNRD